MKLVWFVPAGNGGELAFEILAERKPWVKLLDVWVARDKQNLFFWFCFRVSDLIQSCVSPRQAAEASCVGRLYQTEAPLLDIAQLCFLLLRESH